MSLFTRKPKPPTHQQVALAMLVEEMRVVVAAAEARVDAFVARLRADLDRKPDEAKR